jgi:hypothetical protein
MRESENSEQNILAKPLEITPAMFDGKGVLELVDKLDKDMRDIVLDGTTKKGREECITLAANVRKSKAHIDKVGAELVKPIKEKAKVIDLQRRQVKEKLDTLAIYLRKPATDWEIAEEARVSNHRSNLQKILNLKENLGALSVDNIERLKDALQHFRELDFEEYSNDATLYIDGVQGALDTATKEAEKRAADAAELERLRKEQAEREAQEQKPVVGTIPAEIRPFYGRLGLFGGTPMSNKAIDVPEDQQPETETYSVPDPYGREHKRNIHNEIASALSAECGFDEDTAKSVVVAMVRRKVPHISIQY